MITKNNKSSNNINTARSASRGPTKFFKKDHYRAPQNNFRADPLGKKIIKNNKSEHQKQLNNFRDSTRNYSLAEKPHKYLDVKLSPAVNIFFLKIRST